MYFLNKIKDLIKKEKLIIFVDMDGVIADYDFGNILDFKNKRPITTNINTLREISNLKNVTLCILSICKKEYEIKEKNLWLDKNASFFSKENRYIISKEKNPNTHSKTIKVNFIKNYDNMNKKIVVIEDDNSILKLMRKELKDVILFQDSSLLD